MEKVKGSEYFLNALQFLQISKKSFIYEDYYITDRLSQISQQHYLQCWPTVLLYSGAKKYLVSHQLCKFSHLKR